VTSRELIASAVPLVPLLAGLAVAAVPSARAGERLALLSGIPTAVLAAVTCIWALAASGRPILGHWLCIDAAGGVLIGVIGLVGAASLAVSPAYLATAGSSLFGRARPSAHYYTALLLFWAALLAVPLAANLGAAWLLIEATTAASALLVAFSGKSRALEAAWKYLVLTSLGLGIALLGILVLQLAQHRAASPLGLSFTDIHAAAPQLDHRLVLLAYLLLLTGLAAKIGWAPVHNWLPDAHSEAPAPVSALLSAALLPTVLLVAWRIEQALAAGVGPGTARHVFLFFGLASLAVAVPFLWRSLAWKRLLAYSSLEHMGVIALGIGFGGPLALAGVVVHVAGHALAKALGFYAAMPLLGLQPSAASHAPRGVARADARTGAVVGGALAALAGLPPSPLFVSELMIAIGGIRAGYTSVVVIALILLSLGFLGLGHALIEAVAGRRRGGGTGIPAGRRPVVLLAGACAVLMPALAGAALALPGSAIEAALMRGLA
jgi:hydrogenase-4 component F